MSAEKKGCKERKLGGFLRLLNKSKTHVQSRCPSCGLWTVWTDKKTGEAFSECDGEKP